MPPLFVDRTIEIDALPFLVWRVLTKPEYNNQWASEFQAGAPLRIESDWRIGAPVSWKDAQDRTIVEGNVTRLEPEKLLRFTVFDTRSTERPAVSEEDGITFELSRKGAQTILHLRQGDFAAMADGGKYQKASADIWERVLPKIKFLAERTAGDSQEKPHL